MLDLMDSLVKKIIIEPSNVWGKTIYKPACATSRYFCELLGQKTLTEDNLRIIKKMGYSLEQKVPPLKLF